MKKSLLTMIILGAAVFALTACNAAPAETTTEDIAPQPALIIAEGRLLPAEYVDQSFTVPGEVAEVLVANGDTVTAGDALVRLVESPDAVLALARARSEALAAQQALDALTASADLNLANAKLAVIDAEDALDSAQSRYDANKSDENQAALDAANATLTLAQDALKAIEDGQGIDPDALALAEARVESANAALSSAEALVAAHTLTAAQDGVVVGLNLLPGQRVAAGAPVLSVADLDAWVVKTDNLTELDVAAIAVGQKVDVVLDALPETTLTGTVSEVALRYEEKRGDITYTVTISIDPSDAPLRWGMTAAVRFIK